MPVMIKGETGVGKTALLEMLSKLWNYSILLEWKRQRNRLLDFVRRKLEKIPADVSNSYQVYCKLYACKIIPSKVQDW